MRFLRPSVLLIAGGAILATLTLFLFPGGEVQLLVCTLVLALAGVLHRAATTDSMRRARWRHDGRAEQFERAQPIRVTVEDA